MSSIRRSILAAAVVLLGGCDQREVQIGELVDKVWVHYDTEWVAAPRDVGTSEMTSYVQIAEFDSEGGFSLVGAILRKNGTRYTVSAGDGQVVSLGTWKLTDSQVSVNYKKVFETIPEINGAKPASLKAPVRLANEKIFVGEAEFRELRAIDVKSYRKEFVAPYRPEQGDARREEKGRPRKGARVN